MDFHSALLFLLPIIYFKFYKLQGEETSWTKLIQWLPVTHGRFPTTNSQPDSRYRSHLHFISHRNSTVNKVTLVEVFLTAVTHSISVPYVPLGSQTYECTEVLRSVANVRKFSSLVYIKLVKLRFCKLNDRCWKERSIFCNWTLAAEQTYVLWEKGLFSMQTLSKWCYKQRKIGQVRKRDRERNAEKIRRGGKKGPGETFLVTGKTGLCQGRNSWNDVELRRCSRNQVSPILHVVLNQTCHLELVVLEKSHGEGNEDVGIERAPPAYSPLAHFPEERTKASHNEASSSPWRG